MLAAQARRATAALLLAAVAGCGTLSGRPPVVPAPLAERETRLLALAGFDARGRIAVRQGSRGGQGNLRWQQAGDDATIGITGPFGAGAVEILWNRDRVAIRSRDGETVREYLGNDAAEAFVAEQIGVPVPVQALRYWLLGLVDPAAEARDERDTEGRLTLLDQHGWTLRYAEHRLVGDLWLPRRLDVTREDARLRLVIDDWQL